MKAVLMSVQPRWCEKIASGQKTLEIRKTRPKFEPPFKVYIYQTKTGAKQGARCAGVIGEFTCDAITRLYPVSTAIDGLIRYDGLSETGFEQTCLTQEELCNYGGRKNLFAWHISDLIIYDKPKNLREFHFPPERFCEHALCGGCPYDQVAGESGDVMWDCEWKRPLQRPPQSWCYVEELQARWLMKSAF